ncbi:MAG TPA: hypothetical protein VJB35_01700 [Candidatus Nanoarchaeia archaeon]|nr:hypothetical protein [Candidatus Nanoarchaeia archaeon]
MLLIVSSVNAIIKYNEQKRNIYVKMNIILENKSQEIEKFIIKQEKFFWQAYNQNLFIKLLETNKQDLEYNQTLNETINYFEKFPTTSMGVIDNKGIIVADKERWLIGYDTTESYPESIMYLKEDFYEKENTYMILPHPDSGIFYLLIMKKIFNKKGEFLGYFSYRVPDEEMVKFLMDLNGESNFIESYLVNENLFLLTPSKILKKENSGVLTQVINTSTVSQCVNNIEAIKQNKEINKSSGEIIEYITYSGDEVVGIYNIILSPRWCLIVEINKEKMFEDFFKKIITNQLPASFL